MVITAPHAGSLWVALRYLLDRTDTQGVEPPRSSKRTMSLGVKHSPEWACLPFKITLGNFIEAIEMGADTVLMAGGPNLCRLGYYPKLQDKILHDLGYDVEMLAFNWQEEQIVGLLKFIRRIMGDRPWREVIGIVKHGIQQLSLMDDLERKVQWTRPREVDQGEATKVWRSAGPRVSASHTPEQLKAIRKELFGELAAIERNPDAQPLKVGLLGEFFMVLDPFCNMDIEEELGKRNVEVVRSAHISEWAKAWLFLEFVGLSHGQKVKRAAEPYLSRDPSGDAVQSLGETVLHSQEGFAGIVHLQPFTCMPELIAQNIFPNVSRDWNIPVLEIVIDEQMAKAGLLTRVEAFVDLMARRKNVLQKQGAPALAPATL